MEAKSERLKRSKLRPSYGSEDERKWDEDAEVYFYFMPLLSFYHFFPNHEIFQRLEERYIFCISARNSSQFMQQKQMKSLHFSLPSMEESFSLWIIKNFNR